MDLLRKIWVIVRSIAKILVQSRFSLLIVLLTVISLEYVGQVKDILVGLSYPESALQVTFFIVAVNWLAFQSWGWARYIYNQTHPVNNGMRGEAGYHRWLLDWLPRLYAVIAFVAAYRAAIHADVTYIAYGIVAVGFLVLLFLIYRRDIAKKTAKLMQKVSDQTMFYFTWIVIGLTSFCAIWSPVAFGGVLGAGAVVFLGLGSIIPVGTMLVSAARENGFPVVGFLLLLAVLFSPFNDNHHVRTIEGETVNTADYSLEQSLNLWLAQRDENKPMVVVATAGGGLRASYWTGAILGRFQDQIADFNKQLFAISGVSGGSVGAVFYNGALLNDADCVSGGKNCFEENLLSAIGRDYLAPTATSMLYGDLIQRFVPFPIFSDRAAALEESWEAGFAASYPNAVCGLDNEFTRFYSSDECTKGRWVPRLLINGTYEETGRRLLTTSFKVLPETFLDTHDFYELNGQKAIRASTAALNSARFSYVSPAGTFSKTVKHEASGKEKVKNMGHVIDGGYFENYGANTLTNLLDWLRKHPREPLSNGLIVIAISNDSTIPLEQYQLNAEPQMGKSQTFLNEVLAPVLGLANTRNGHGMLAYKQLEQYSRQINKDATVNMVHFYIAKDEGEEPPLGWILSQQAKENMRKQIDSGENCQDYQLVIQRLGGASKRCD